MIEKIQSQIISLDVEPNVEDKFRCAAVLVPLVYNERQKRWDVIFTRRAEHLKHHPGQISFPGGGFETQDKDLSETALRETFEEIGIKQQQIRLIGRLPQQKTVSQYNMTPFVGVVDPNYQLTIDPTEVAEVFTAPFDFVTNTQFQEKVSQTINGTDYEFYVIKYQDYNIWGATARILVNLTRRINRDSPL